MSSFDYSEAIADLERRRDDLDAAIRVLRGLAEESPPVEELLNSSPPPKRRVTLEDVKAEVQTREPGERYPDAVRARARALRKETDLTMEEIANTLGEEFEVEPPSVQRIHAWVHRRRKATQHPGAKFPQAVRDRAVELARSGMTRAAAARQVSEEFDCPEPSGWSVTCWLRKAPEAPPAKPEPKEREEGATTASRAHDLLAKKRLIDPGAVMIDRDGVFVIQWKE
jgi:transposase-like protein